MAVNVYADTDVIVNKFLSNMELDQFKIDLKKKKDQNKDTKTIERRIHGLEDKKEKADKFFELCKNGKFRGHFSNMTVAELSGVIQKLYALSKPKSVFTPEEIAALQTNSAKATTKTVRTLTKQYNFSRIPDEEFLESGIFLRARGVIDETWGYIRENDKNPQRYKRAGMDDILHIFAAISKSCRYLVSFDRGLTILKHNKFDEITLVNLADSTFDTSIL